MLVAAGIGPPVEHALISLLALNGLRVSEATGADIEHLGVERGHRTLTITRKGGKVVTIPLAPRTARAIDLAIAEGTDGPVFLAADDGGWTGTVPGGSSARPPAAPGSPRPSRPTRSGTRSLSPPRFRPEARRIPGLAASCITSIRYSVRHVRQGRYQGLSLFAAAFDLTWLTCLSSENAHLPGIFQDQVQITFITAALDAGVPLRDVQEAASHADPRTTMRYDNSRELHRPGEKPQVSRSRQGRDSVPRLRTAAV